MSFRPPAPSSKTFALAGGAAQGDDTGRAAEPEAVEDRDAEIEDLRQRLEQSEARARRAYAAAEAAEAGLGYERERFARVDSQGDQSGELSELRSRVGELLQRVTKAEDGKRKAEADLAAMRAGLDPVEQDEATLQDGPTRDSDDPHSGGSATGSEEGGGLRARLAGTAIGRKGRNPDAQEWR